MHDNFNARCANLQDTIAFSNFSDRSNSVVEIPINSDPNILLINLKDTISNDRGKKLVSLCMMSDLHIVNRRKNGDLFGEKLALDGMETVS